MFYLSSVLAVTVALLIRAEILGLKPQIYVLKPVSTLLVIGVAALSLTEPVYNASYSYWILLGLGLCFGGDLALMFQDRRRPFMIGLVLFLLGHLAYTVAFTLLGVASGRTLLAGLVLLAAGLAFYRLISARLGSMRLAVILYFLIISLMVMQATSPVLRFRRHACRQPFLATLEVQSHQPRVLLWWPVTDCRGGQWLRVGRPRG
jgi:uncharacterized membrane protein YhhN